MRQGTRLLNLLAVAVTVLVGRPRSFVDGAAISSHRNSPDEVQNALTSSGSTPDVHGGDEEVQELHSLKPSSNGLIAMEKSISGLYTDVNGHKEAHVESKQEVSQNGQRKGSMDVVFDSKDVPQSATPATHLHAELEVPSKGVHRVFDSQPGTPSSHQLADLEVAPQGAHRPRPDAAFTHQRTEQEDRPFDSAKRRVLVPHPDSKENNVDINYRSNSHVQYSPLDMAEYVFWTGDEKGVTMAIEEFLQDGLMTREEAIIFLQEIKINLDYLQNHYAEERFQRQELARERANQLQKSFKFDKMSSPAKLSEVRQLMKENLSKKNVDTEDVFNPSATMSRLPASLTDDDYQDLLERLRVADFLYTEYSLEEVIYQLAKVMFSQSLNRGSSEAQEALQKFTGFLEAEEESGRISHSLEKKVLDVLVTSLTDTLTEHPELVSAARAGLTQSGSNGMQLSLGQEDSTSRFHGSAMKKTSSNP